MQGDDKVIGTIPGVRVTGWPLERVRWRERERERERDREGEQEREKDREGEREREGEEREREREGEGGRAGHRIVPTSARYSGTWYRA